jgi:hypothetical protein
MKRCQKTTAVKKHAEVFEQPTPAAETSKAVPSVGEEREGEGLVGQGSRD